MSKTATRFKPVTDLNLKIICIAPQPPERPAGGLDSPMGNLLAELTANLGPTEWACVHDGTRESAKQIYERTSGSIRQRYGLCTRGGQVWITTPANAPIPKKINRTLAVATKATLTGIGKATTAGTFEPIVPATKDVFRVPLEALDPLVTFTSMAKRDQTKTFIAAWQKHDCNLRQICDELGIEPSLGMSLVKQYRTDGLISGGSR